MIKYTYLLPIPTHIHDCKKCQFLYGIRVDNELRETLRIVDVYEQCGGRGRYLVRYSSEGPDYSSSLDIEDFIRLWVTETTREKKKVDIINGTPEAKELVELLRDRAEIEAKEVYYEANYPFMFGWLSSAFVSTLSKMEAGQSIQSIVKEAKGEA